jgi:HAD superfamily hydrolase (TIGR01509 family)
MRLKMVGHISSMTIKAVIFDLDGTITRPFFDFDAIRKEMGYSPNAGPILELMGKMTSQQREDAERILQFHEEKAVAESTLNPGARETLEELHKRGILIGILTRNKRDNAFAVAEKHGLKFDAVVGREQGPVKPDAFGVQYLCERFAIMPQESLVVGDYLFDLLCARAAGAISVLLANHEKADQFAQYADFVIENITEILQIIEGKKGNPPRSSLASAKRVEAGRKPQRKNKDV